VTVTRRQIGFTVLLAGFLPAFGIIAFEAWESRAFFEPQRLLSRFPAEDSLVVSIDVATLRRAGLLSTSKTPTESDYKEFVSGTSFDYKRDLDSVVATFSQSGSFFIARGRFHWAMLRDYAIRQGGSCYQDLCRVAGSRPERHISFLPLRKDAIALAVGNDDLAAARLTRPAQPITDAIPAAPVWISVSGAQLRRPNSLPSGMRLMLSALANADRIVLTFGLSNRGFEALMEATCHTPDDAKLLANQLRSTTAILREAAARDKTSADDEVTALLTGGSFDQNDRRVRGKWPVRKSLIEALTDGI